MVHGMESPPPFDLQAYQPPISLWKLVEQYVPFHETEEIKNMLGESLIDQSLELHDEINTLLEIWRDYREETTTAKPVKKLAEPPGVRDRLIQEIQFVIGNVKDKAKTEGVNADKILSRHNADVLDYALDSYRAESTRPTSRQALLGMDGRETPMICSPTCSDRTSEASILSEEVEGMNEKLNVLNLDEVTSHLRSTLEDEVETLMRDIYFLHNCLDDEATFRAESTGALTREPTLSDLREERSSLQKDLTNMTVHTSPELIKQPFVPAQLNRQLGPSVVSGGKVKAGISSDTKLSPIKPGPLKAFNSPEAKGNCVSSGGSIRSQNSDRKEPMKATTHASRVGGANANTPMSGKDRHSSGHEIEGASSLAASSMKHRPADSARISRQNRSANETRTQTERDTYSRNSDSRQPTLEAVVTLSKGKAGEATELHLLPSPPSSAKPSSSRRPGSAQRFRNMVLDCRDSK